MKKTVKSERSSLDLRVSQYTGSHKKNSLSEVTLKPKYLSSEVQEQIREYLKKDLEAHLPQLKLQRSRDISHIKDFKFPKASPYPLDLPKDLNELQKLVSCKSLTSIEICNKGSCIDRILSSYSDVSKLKTVKYLEKIDNYIPSGRKEAQNLLTWFHEMRRNYEQNEDFEIVIVKCAEELLRQITVNCKERGELLKLILGYLQTTFDSKQRRIEENAKEVEVITAKNTMKLKRSHQNEIEIYRSKVEELHDQIKVLKETIGHTQQECGIYKRKFYEMQKIFLEEKRKIRQLSLAEQPEFLTVKELPPSSRSRKVHRTELTTDYFALENQSGSAAGNSRMYFVDSPLPTEAKFNSCLKGVSVQTSFEEISKTSKVTDHKDTEVNESKFSTHTKTISFFPSQIIVRKMFHDKYTQSIEQVKGNSEGKKSNDALRLHKNVKQGFNVQKTYSFRRGVKRKVTRAYEIPSEDLILNSLMKSPRNEFGNADHKESSDEYSSQTISENSNRDESDKSDEGKPKINPLKIMKLSKSYNRTSILITPANSLTIDDAVDGIQLKPQKPNKKRSLSKVSLSSSKSISHKRFSKNEKSAYKNSSKILSDNFPTKIDSLKLDLLNSFKSQVNEKNEIHLTGDEIKKKDWN